LTEVRQFDTRELGRIPLPAILLTNTKHFDVVYRVDASGAHVLDGADGAKKRLPHESFTGYALIRKRDFAAQAVDELSEPGVQITVAVINLTLIGYLMIGVMRKRRESLVVGRSGQV
jgi:ABC-type bacteriocin/lantibiotic exporter with double-glycine peptidase domain